MYSKAEILNAISIVGLYLYHPENAVVFV